ncbi:MAG: hypothetical protein QNJ60_20000 [Xenococcaceae cyanobacterium MO_188.B19]|nr:hypothetical protein [Xenococcaceae cyanobacterium MO_188.B19]
MLKTIPQQRSIHKLFATVAGSPFPIAHRYGIRKSDLTSWLKDFTCSSSPEQNHLSLVFEVLNADLVFVYKNIVQQC